MSTRVVSLDQPVKPGCVRMRYVGAYRAPVTFYANGRPYAAAQTDKWKFVDVLAEDVERMKATSQFVVVSGVAPMRAPDPPPPPPPPPSPIKPPEVKPVEVKPEPVAAPKVQAETPKVEAVAVKDAPVVQVETVRAKPKRKSKAK